MFFQEPTAMGYFEVYGSVPNFAGVDVALELANTPEGPAIIRVPAILTPTQDPDLRRASGVVPLAKYPVGDYVVRGIVTIDGKQVGRVIRTLRKATS
jgi:hypothetical protein